MPVDPSQTWLPLSVLAWAVHMVVFHGLGYAFEWCDANGRLSRFKVRAIDRLTYKQLLPRVLFNQTAILLPSMVALEYSGLAFVGEAHLSPARFVFNLVLLAIGHDVVQYIGHRFMHMPSMMPVIGHTLHHTTGASKAISACYQTSADFFIEIVCPYLLPLILIGGGGSDVFFHLLVPSMGAVGGLYEHSGYDFAVVFRDPAATGWRKRLNGALAAMTSSIAHGYHHTRGNVSFSDGFGSPGICDSIFKTRWDLVPERVRRRGGEA